MILVRGLCRMQTTRVHVPDDTVTTHKTVIMIKDNRIKEEGTEEVTILKSLPRLLLLLIDYLRLAVVLSIVRPFDD